jgi:hypothetical protein
VILNVLLEADMARNPKSIALLTIHGMGETPKNYHKLFLERVKKYVGENDWKNVAFESIYYQDILQANQAEIYHRMKPRIRWQGLRRFLLYNFSDAASLDYRKEEANSAYQQAQSRISSALHNVYEKCGRRDVPVVILAYSLGCHVISNYIWDAQQASPSAGIWKKSKSLKEGAETNFLRLPSLQHLITVGCNIPVFVAGYKSIAPFRKPNRTFKWLNLYDKDDILGWPLEPLSPSYRKLVKDVQINANEKFSDLLLKSWNPYSHENYFGDSAVVRSVGDALKS